jgi:hypothetical protein
MKANRPTFKMQSYWTALIAVSLFTTAYVPETRHGKLICVGVVLAVSLLAYLRRAIAAGLSDGKSTVSESVVERVLMTVFIAVTLGTVYWAKGEVMITMLTCLIACSVAEVASKRAHDRSERDVNTTQLGVFHLAPVVVALALVGAYMAGVSVWFVIGFAALTAVSHMLYGHSLDEVEKRPSNVVLLDESDDTPSTVVPLRAVDNTTTAS